MTRPHSRQHRKHSQRQGEGIADGLAQEPGILKELALLELLMVEPLQHSMLLRCEDPALLRVEEQGTWRDARSHPILLANTVHLAKTMRACRGEFSSFLILISYGTAASGAHWRTPEIIGVTYALELR